MSATLPHTTDQIAKLLVDAGFTGWQVVNMGVICMAESGGNGYAVNVNHSPEKASHRSIDAGLWQINSYWWGGNLTATEFLRSAFDPAQNAATAKNIWDARLKNGLARGIGFAAASDYAYRAWNAYVAGALAQLAEQPMSATLPHTTDQIAKLLVDAGFTGWQVVNMGAICMAESGGNGYAVNVNHSPEKASHRSIDAGLWQINSYWWGGNLTATEFLRSAFDPAQNAATAKSIWDGRLKAALAKGLSFASASDSAYRAWNAYVAGAHTQYIPAARDAWQKATQ